MESVQNSVCLGVINGWIVETVDGIDKHFFVVGKIDLSVLSEFSAVMHELRINKPKTSGFNGNRLTVFVMGVNLINASALERKQKADSNLSEVITVGNDITGIVQVM